MDPGDLVMHGPLTIHSAEANRSQRPRRALLQLFAGASARVDEEALRAYEADLSAIRAQMGREPYRFAAYR
jgi:ectoine hydroxylase-related dioxygenase (phytanoyl-CoA dioxygenase family)